MKIRLQYKIIVTFIGLLLCCGGVIFLIADTEISRVITLQETEQFNTLINTMYPGGWSRIGEELYKGTVLLNNNFSIVDTLKAQTRSIAAIFLGNVQITSNLRLPNGQRMVGTKAPQTVVAQVLNRGREFIGEAKLNNRRYLVRYSPLKDSEGKIIGMWFAGIEKSQLDRKTYQVNLKIALTILGVLIACIIVAFFLSKHILKAIPSLLAVFDRAARGDLTVAAKIVTRDEMRTLSEGFNQMIRQQREMMIKVLNSAVQVKAAASQIAAVNQDLSQRTQEQAATLQEVAATVEQVNSLAHHTSANSRQADELSRLMYQAAQGGGQSVAEALQAMDGISGSSQKISDIIKVVNELAFQTNLLALNAAVEAARAGEQGRGFAVVAAEVRNLAGRTAEAAREIERLIQGNGEQVEQGNQLVRQSAAALQEIIKQIEGTSKVIAEVASAMQEQATATTQIQDSLAQLNQVTQQNAAIVEETAASSETLNAEAEVLHEMVSGFKVESEVDAASKVQSETNPLRSSSSRLAPMGDTPSKQTPAMAIPLTNPQSPETQIPQESILQTLPRRRRPEPRPLSGKPEPSEDGWEKF
ncbi:MAG TPA: methyl-accepting chemotaxis protein [Bacillota bacterium]